MVNKHKGPLKLYLLESDHQTCTPHGEIASSETIYTLNGLFKGLSNDALLIQVQSRKLYVQM